MMTLNLGPLAVPLIPLVTLLALVLTTVLVRRVSVQEERDAADSAVWWAAAAGLAGARLAHVVVHAEVYRVEPLGALDIRDGGFMTAAGLLVGAGVLLWRVRRTLRVSQRAVLVAASCGAGLWLLAGPAIEQFKPAPGQALSAIPVRLQPMGTGPAPALTLSEIQAHADGRPVILNLWASWCGPCKAEMPLLAQAQREHPEVLFLLVNQGESEPMIQAFLQRERLVLQDVWRDPDSALGPAIGSGGLPTTVVFDARGQRLQAHVGMLTAASLRLMVHNARRSP